MLLSTKAYSSGFIQIEYCKLNIEIEIISKKVVEEIINDIFISPKVTLKNDIFDYRDLPGSW